jgi:hypothetical protein
MILRSKSFARVYFFYYIFYRARGPANTGNVGQKAATIGTFSSLRQVCGQNAAF